MNGKNILIVGGTHGIGLEVAKQLQEQEAELWIAARTNDNLENLQGARHIAFDAEKDEFDGSSLPDELHGVLYAPGTINLKPFHRLSAEDFQHDLAVNYLGAVKVLQAIHKSLKKSSSASVVLMSTVAVQMGMPFHASIAGAKGAVEGLVRSLAAEWAPRIRVNGVAPALVDTRLADKLLSTDDKKEASNKRHPLQRYGNPDDIAQAVLYLLDEKSSWMTGQILGVDGGMSSVRI